MNHVLDRNAGMGLESMLNCLLFSMKVQMSHMHKSQNWEFTIAVNLASQVLTTRVETMEGGATYKMTHFLQLS
jgi:hypothetical protein